MDAKLQNICKACGTRYGRERPSVCVICADDRQYIPPAGQQWTSQEEMARDHTIRFSQRGNALHTLQIMPSFAIGQRAFLLQSPGGNVLWDCLPFIDPPTVAYLRSLGGIQAIAISHPHYYSLMVEWAILFDCPVYIHQHDEQWIMDWSETHLRLWQGDRQALWDGIEIIRTGGHFPGSTVLFVPNLGKGTLLTGDTIYVGKSRQWVTCMYSYPNQIPLPKGAIEHVVKQVTPLSFDALYGAFDGQDIVDGAKHIFSASMNRYLSIVSGS